MSSSTPASNSTAWTAEAAGAAHAASPSPWRRTWLRFRQQRLGYWSLVIFVSLFVISLLGEVLSNDRPLLVRYDGHYYFPIVKDYPETLFGGDFPARANYLDPYIRSRLESNGNFAVYPPNHFHYDTIDYFAAHPYPAPPTTSNWLGTDQFGRDVLARLLYGFRLSVLMALALTVSGVVVGVLTGAVQGFYGGRTDLIGQRLIEIWSSMPDLYLLIIFASIFEPTLWLLFILLSMFGWLRAVGLRARRISAQPFARLRQGGAHDGPDQLADHVAPCIAEQPDAGDHLPAVPHERGDSLADQPRLSRPRRTAAHTEPRRTAAGRQEQSRRMVDLDVGVCRAGDHASVIDLHGRRIAQRTRHALARFGFRRRSAMTNTQAPIGRPLLEIDRFSVRFGDKIAVHELSLSIARGERVALVGESGSGKSVTALSILRLVEHAELSGRMLLDGEDLLQKTEQQMRGLRGADVAMVFQEPMTALNPLFTIGKQIAESLRLHEGLRPNAARERGIELLRRTGIPEPERRIDSFPHQLSGGQRQRAMIAMALACRPRLLLADEPTTALDVTVRQQIVDLLISLQEQEAAERGMAVLLITHDLNLVKRFAQRVAVMEKGVLVETNTTEALFANPQHPYTRRLLDSEPQRAIEPVERRRASAARSARVWPSTTARRRKAGGPCSGAPRSGRCRTSI